MHAERARRALLSIHLVRSCRAKRDPKLAYCEAAGRRSIPSGTMKLVNAPYPYISAPIG
jgi:hypothetical protein